MKKRKKNSNIKKTKMCWDENGAADVIDRAITLAQSGHDISEPACSLFCPYCLVGDAKGQLDKERRTRLPIEDVILNFSIELPSDEPLVTARKAIMRVIKEAPEKYNQLSKAVEVLKNAKNHLKEI